MYIDARLQFWVGSFSSHFYYLNSQFPYRVFHWYSKFIIACKSEQKWIRKRKCGRRKQREQKKKNSSYLFSCFVLGHQVMASADDSTMHRQSRLSLLARYGSRLQDWISPILVNDLELFRCIDFEIHILCLML